MSFVSTTTNPPLYPPTRDLAVQVEEDGEISGKSGKVLLLIARSPRGCNFTIVRKRMRKLVVGGFSVIF